MGIRTEILLDECNSLMSKFGIEFERMQSTENGISDTTYICLDSFGKKYILKIYEFADISLVSCEEKLLNLLYELKVPKRIISADQKIYFENKPVGLFVYLEGESCDYPNIHQISSIGNFLGKLHSITEGHESKNDNLYTQKILKNRLDIIFMTNSIDDEIKNKFRKYYFKIKDVNLENDCIIHGDLFPDNAKFIGDELSGVFDFIEACNGNSLFDLSVVVNSWCFSQNQHLELNKLNKLLEAYNAFSNKIVTINVMKPIMLYSAFFYAVQRFYTKYIEKRNVIVKDYDEYIFKFDQINDKI